MILSDLARIDAFSRITEIQMYTEDKANPFPMEYSRILLKILLFVSLSSCGLWKYTQPFLIYTVSCSRMLLISP